MSLDAPPLAFTWADLVDRLVAERGSLAELARSLQEVASGLADDPLTVERGLRRLRGRGNQQGDKYGRAVIRAFGVPGAIGDWARLLGQYHSRLSDLPSSMKRDQLRLWDRPPVSESPACVWIHIGLATLAHQSGDLQAVAHRLGLADFAVRHAEPAAAVELHLFRARLEEHATPYLDAARDRLGGAGLGEHDRACYLARLQDQLAYGAAQGWRRDRSRLLDSQALYVEIPPGGPPFASFRRHHGLAWCAWRLGEMDALQHAMYAADAAGDGGLVRFRGMALELAAHISGDRELSERAEEIARRLRGTSRVGPH